jgi:hypothetical protein
VRQDLSLSCEGHGSSQRHRHGHRRGGLGCAGFDLGHPRVGVVLHRLDRGGQFGAQAGLERLALLARLVAQRRDARLVVIAQ